MFIVHELKTETTTKRKEKTKHNWAKLIRNKTNQNSRLLNELLIHQFLVCNIATTINIIARSKIKHNFASRHFGILQIKQPVGYQMNGVGNVYYLMFISNHSIYCMLIIFTRQHFHLKANRETMDFVSIIF